MIPPPFSLRCEYLNNPLGIDVPRPRLSWKTRSSERGTYQTAYQILVGSNDAGILAGKGDVWDSGKVHSGRTAQVPYSGSPLKSRTRFFWRVRRWDQGERRSAYSAAAFFETGFLSPKDWKAKWITMNSPRTFRAPGTVMLGKYRGDYVQTFGIYLTKNFETGPNITRARAYVCGLGCYELLINGRKVGDRALDPAQTDYRKTALYTTFDLAGYLDRRNVVTLILGNGRHIENYRYGRPKAICQIEIEYAGGGRRIIVTDASWTAAHGPLRENGLYFGEFYDGAHHELMDVKNAVRAEGPLLRSQVMPPIRVVESLLPRKIVSSSPDKMICDFGQNFAGRLALRIKARPGTKLILRHAELLSEDGSLNVAPNQNAQATDVYVCRGQGVEDFEPKFTYHGFRYAEIGGDPELPRLTSILGRAVHSDVEPAGTFVCSNSLFNRIHRNVVWGLRSNLMGIPTDCPQRDERHGWLGDAHLAAESAILNFDMAAFYAKFLRDIRDAQGKDGSLPDFVPAFIGGFSPADPAWGSAYITLAWLVYWYYGDVDVLAEHYPGLKKYAAFLARNADGDIVRHLGKYGDWCPPGSIAPKKTPLELTSTWFYYHDTLLLSRIAAALGAPEDAKVYASHAARIKKAFNRVFLKGTRYATIQTSPIDRYVSQTSNALPLYLDMAPGPKKEAVLTGLLQSVIGDWDFHLDTGIIGTRYLLEVLSDHGYPHVACRLVNQKTYPGWGYMVREGATTLWERWEKITGGGMNSHNHVMLGSVEAWFHKTIAGVRCSQAGWEKITICPPDLPDLTSARAAVETIRGKVKVDWRREEKSLRVNLQVPPGSEAEMRLPLPRAKALLEESGKRIWSGPGKTANRPEIEILGTQAGGLRLKVLSGAYAFRLESSSG
jgi:alpha-L-rhamnosidase